MDFLLGGNIPAKDRDQGTAALSAYAVSKGCQLSVSIMLKPIVMSLRTISGILMKLKKAQIELFS